MSMHTDMAFLCGSPCRRRILKGAISLLCLQVLCFLILTFHVHVNYFQINRTRSNRTIGSSVAQCAETTRNKQDMLESFQAEQSNTITDSTPHTTINETEDTRKDLLDSNRHIEPISLEKKVKDKTNTEYFLKHNRNVKEVNCKLIIDGDKTEIRKAYDLGTRKRQETSFGHFIRKTQNCSQFIQRRGYIMSELTQEEADFSIAYSILMYKDVEQAERLLRILYRPQNIYCIHVDRKSNASTYHAMKAIASCFDNVFMSPNRVRMAWGYFEILRADLFCMEELLKRSKTWKYFVNLTGQEFPLRTNYELVKILKAYNGANDIEGTIRRANPERWRNKLPPPHNLRPFKGNVHIAANRNFVEYALHNETAKDLLRWVRNNVGIPDECFFATLNHNPSLKIKGSYLGNPESGNHTSDVEKPYLSHFVNWYPNPHHINSWPCHGKWVRTVCVFGPGDLQLLASVPHMFANKFYWDYQRFARDCMEELIFNRTRDEYLGKLHFDENYYKRLGFVRNKVI